MAARRPVQRAPRSGALAPRNPPPIRGSARSCPPTGPRTVPRWRTSPGPPSAATPSTASSAADPARRPRARASPRPNLPRVPSDSPPAATSSPATDSDSPTRRTPPARTSATTTSQSLPTSSSFVGVRANDPRPPLRRGRARTARARSRGSERGAGHTSRRPRVTRPRVSPRPPRPSRTPRTRRDDGTASRRTFANARGPRVQETSRARGPPDASAPASARYVSEKGGAQVHGRGIVPRGATRDRARDGALGRVARDSTGERAPRDGDDATRRGGRSRGRGFTDGGARRGVGHRVARGASRVREGGVAFRRADDDGPLATGDGDRAGKKTVAFPDTREGRENVAAEATSAEEFGDATPTPGDGFGAQERVSMEAHSERLRSLGKSLNPRQRTMVERGMEKARERIRHERSWGG